jgi:hypothetical protein
MLAEPQNNLWFLSVHTTQTQASQMSCKKERRARELPVEYVNWTKWSLKEVYSTTGMSIHERTSAQREPKVPQEINKWWADSASPQPETNRWAAVDKMPRVIRLAFVGNLRRNKRHVLSSLLLLMFWIYTKNIRAFSLNWFSYKIYN